MPSVCKIPVSITWKSVPAHSASNCRRSRVTPASSVVTAAFAASYMVGVVIVLAPAGAGVRELTLIALLAPLLGVPSATAAALLMRVVHTIDDFAIAGIAWLATLANITGVDLEAALAKYTTPGRVEGTKD